jgi:hypothetical protein
MEKKNKGKPIKEVVFSTRNKAVILHSKMYGPEKTNELLDKCFSNDIIVSKLLEAEKHGFSFEGIALCKTIEKPELDASKCEKKYWEKVKENLLKIYDEETTEAIIEHYNPLMIESEPDLAEYFFNIIGQYFTDDSPNAKNLGIHIEFHPDAVEEYSNIEKRINNKIIKYLVKWEEIVSVFIESHIQVFG